MAAENEIKLIVEAEVKKAIDGLKKVQGESEKTGNVFTRTGERIKQSWITIAAGLATSFAAAKKAFDFTSEFARFQQSTTAMQKQFGKSADEVIAKLKAVSAGTISNAKLVEGANRAMALNVTTDLDKMAKLLEVARFRAQAMGIDTTQAFNDIVTGIGRNSPLILDNLGIITKGWAEEAQAAGVAYDQQFLLNKILGQGAIEIEKAGGVTITAAERMQQLGATIDNAKLKIGEGLLPAFEVIVPIIKNAVEYFSKLPDGLKLTAVAAGVLTPAIIALNAAFGPLGIVLAGVVGGMTVLMAKLNEASQATEDRFQQAKLEKTIELERLKQIKQRIAALEKEKLALIANGGSQKQLKEISSKLAAEQDLLTESKGRLAEVSKREAEIGMTLGKTNEEISSTLVEYHKGLLKVADGHKAVNAAKSAGSKGFVNEGDLTLEEKAALAKRIEALDEQIMANRIAKMEEGEQAIKESRINAMTEWANAAMEISSNLLQHRINDLEAEKVAIDEKVKNGVLSEEEGNKAKAQLDKQIRSEKKKQAQLDKAQALIDIAISQAVGSAKIWSQWGAYPPVAAALNAGLAAVGIAQTAIVASQPLPAYEMGTSSAQGGSALVGEVGPEVVNLPPGAEVIPNYKLRADSLRSVTNNKTDNFDNRNITINVQATDYEDFIRQAQQRFGRSIFV